MSARIHCLLLLSTVTGLVDLLAMDACETKTREDQEVQLTGWRISISLILSAVSVFFLVKVSAVCSYLAYFGAVLGF